MGKSSNKCYVSRICWLNMMGIDRMITKLCGGTEGDLGIVLCISVPDLGKLVYVSCRRQTSPSGVVALSVMRVRVAFVDIGSKEARLSQNPIMNHLSKHFSSDCRLVIVA
jgi:hypothetical protein